MTGPSPAINLTASDLAIRALGPVDAEALDEMWHESSAEYRQYFTPFPFDAASLRARLGSAVNDRYWGIWFNGRLAAFFMLRGFDAGFQVPSYGVLVRASASGLGLLKLTLAYSVAWCQSNGVSEVMLKVHPDNHRAYKAYIDFGFVAGDDDPRTGHTVMRRTLRHS